MFNKPEKVKILQKDKLNKHLTNYKLKEKQELFNNCIIFFIKI